MSNTFDAIVIGSGVSGGWAAKELCEKGLKTVVLERGRMVKHIKDYPTTSLENWELPNFGALTEKEKEDHHIQVRASVVGETNVHFFANDKDSPYEEVKYFDWIRGHHVGGKSITWGKHCYRLSDLDFEANAKDGYGIDWPVRYKDIESWYTHVEKFAGISGEKLGLPHLPDGHFLPPMELKALEKLVKKSIETNFPGRYLTVGRQAYLTEPINGRGKCQYRNRCTRGCPFGAYFSSNAVTIPAAEKTGNLTIVPHSIVNSIIYDDKLGKATGVRVINEETNAVTEYFAKVIFCNASAMSTNHILLNSTSSRFPNGFGNDNGLLGKYIMDHHFRVGATGKYAGLTDRTYTGRRPASNYIPRYWNLDKKTENKNFLRGFGYQGNADREGWGRGGNEKGFGGEFKESLTGPGDWGMFLVGFGECLPYEDNTVSLHKTKTDKWGQPQLSFNCEFKENELNMRKQMKADASEMLEKAGLHDVEMYDKGPEFGAGIHEMGGARMGHDPKTSITNKWNQIHGAKNVFITDGAFMTSSACVNPSITYMAFTARAVDYAVSELKKQNL